MDGFSFDGEWPVLWARCRELADVADVMVVCEANRTHQGDVRDTFLPVGVHHVAAGLPSGLVWVTADLAMYDGTGRGGVGSGHMHEREREQRSSIRQGFVQAGVDDDDLVFVSDVDEIPSAAAFVEAAPRSREVVGIEQRMHVWRLCWRWPGTWVGTTVSRFGDHYDPSAQRALRALGMPVTEAGGWHLSSQGGPDAVRTKFLRFSHAELLPRLDTLPDLADRGVDVHGTSLDHVDDLASVSWPAGLLDEVATGRWPWPTCTAPCHTRAEVHHPTGGEP